MIRHLITLIWNQRKQNGWIFAELALVLLAVFMITDGGYSKYTLYNEPLGYNIDRCWRLHLEEMEFLKRLEPEIKFFRFEKSEEYFSELSEEEQLEEVKNIKNGINFAKKVLTTGECDLVILDEVLGLVDHGLIDAEELKTLIGAKLDDTDLIMTGWVLSDELRPYIDEIYHLIPEKQGKDIDN